MNKYIIDLYDKYNTADKSAARLVFMKNDRQWAIKEYPYQNGCLMRPPRIDEPDNINDQFYLYDTFNDALQFIQQIRSLN